MANRFISKKRTKDIWWPLVQQNAIEIRDSLAPTHSTLPKKKGNKHLSPTNSPPFPPPAGTESVAKAKFPWHFTTTVCRLSETETS